MKNGECFTLLGFIEEKLVATGSIYYYDVMPSNENPIGRVGQMTNIYVDRLHRNQGIAKKIIMELIDLSKRKVGLICLNSSKEAIEFYSKLGFDKKDNYFVLNMKNEKDE